MDRADFGERFCPNLHHGYGPEPVELVRKLFVRAASPDALLGLLQLHTNATTAPISDMVMNANLEGFRLMADGSVDPNVLQQARVLADAAGKDILELLNRFELEAYRR